MSGFDSSAFLASCSGRPGVYRMFDADAKLLYVGKAKNLKKRLASYFRKTGQPPKTAALVAKIAQIETTITANETEALLLEQTLNFCRYFSIMGPVTRWSESSSFGDA